MILYQKKPDIENWIKQLRTSGKSIGFVPTMGALHQGHGSLLKMSRAENDISICSIFINPTQFNDIKDFNKYPVTLDSDIAMLESVCDVLFLPSVEEMYPQGLNAAPHYDLGYIETILDGKFRPGHFQGVCNIVDRLLKIVQPGKLYVGQKDYQQCIVISKLLYLTNSATKLVIAPTLREDSGLAMSSRNMRLSENEKKEATIIYRSLLEIKRSLITGPLSTLKLNAVKSLEANGLRPDYVEIADAATLIPADSWDGKQKLVALVAAYMNEVRLIDNMLIN